MMAAKKSVSWTSFYLFQLSLPTKLLSQPKPPGRILTSQECVKTIEEKERKQKIKLLEKDLKNTI